MSITGLTRIPLAYLPTPLVEATNLTELLEGPRVLFKRDDLTGLAFGGNKVRKLEYLLAQARAEGADTIVAAGAYQSNMARLTAAAARTLGMAPVLILSGTEEETPTSQGNILLDDLLGAVIHFVTSSDRWEFGDVVRDVTEDLTRQGRKVFSIPLGGSTPESTVAYVSAAFELNQQLWEQGLRIDFVILPTGTGGTQAGLELGARMLGASWQTIGISVSREEAIAKSKVCNLMNDTADMLGVPYRTEPSDITVLDDYIGEGYGAVTEEAREAIRLVARADGVFLDPVYTGKAMAGLIDQVRTGNIDGSQSVVFLHTGGLPALFARAEELVELRAHIQHEVS